MVKLCFFCVEVSARITNISIAAAGIIRDIPFLENTEKDFRDVMNVNVSNDSKLIYPMVLHALPGKWSIFHCTTLCCKNGRAEDW